MALILSSIVFKKRQAKRPAWNIFHFCLKSLGSYWCLCCGPCCRLGRGRDQAMARVATSRAWGHGEQDIHPSGVRRSFLGPRQENAGLSATQKGTEGWKPLAAALSSLMTLSFCLKKAKISRFNLIKRSTFESKNGRGRGGIGEGCRCHRGFESLMVLGPVIYYNLFIYYLKVLVRTDIVLVSVFKLKCFQIYWLYRIINGCVITFVLTHVINNYVLCLVNK